MLHNTPHEHLVMAKKKKVIFQVKDIQTSGGEIIGVLKKLKDEMSADLADSQKGKRGQQGQPCVTFRSEEARTCHCDNRDEPATFEWEDSQKSRAEELVTVHETMKLLNDDGSRKRCVLPCADLAIEGGMKDDLPETDTESEEALSGWEEGRTIDF